SGVYSCWIALEGPWEQRFAPCSAPARREISESRRSRRVAAQSRTPDRPTGKRVGANAPVVLACRWLPVSHAPGPGVREDPAVAVTAGTVLQLHAALHE